MEQKWYKKSFFRNLVDMHIADTDERLLSRFDPEAYAENLAHAGFDTAYIYASSCLGLSYFPNDTAPVHSASRTRDLFGETVAACRARGIRPVGYLNNWSTAAYDAHPEFRVIDKEGRGYRDHPGHAGRYGVLCPNTPYRDYFLSLVREVCLRYPIEGLWVDMVGFWRGACYCACCRERYRAETGREIPERVDFRSSEWLRYLRFKTETVAAYARDIVRTAKEARPDITVSIQSAGWSLGHFLGFDEDYFSAFDYAAGDFYTDVPAGITDCRVLSALTKDAPFEYMVSRCPTLTYHTVSKPLSLLRSQAYAALLTGGAFVLIDAIDPEGTQDPAVYERFRLIRESVAPYLTHPARLGGASVADVGVYINFASAIDPSQNGSEAGRMGGGAAPLFAGLSRIDRALASRHIGYDILTGKDLSRLSDYSLIILSELYVLTKEECEALRAFVAAGGNLYVSGMCGTLRPIGEAEGKENLAREDFALSDTLGVSLAGVLPYDSCYLSFTENCAILDEKRESHPLGTRAPAPAVTAKEDTRVLATATLPFSNHSDGRAFISAISDPPWERTSIPVLTEHTYGRGTCIYSSLLLERDKNEELRDLWLDLIGARLSKDTHIAVSAPACVETDMRREGDTLYVKLLHTLWDKTEAPAGKTDIFIPDTRLSIRHAALFPNGDVTLTRVSGGTLVTLTQLPELAFLTLS